MHVPGPFAASPFYSPKTVYVNVRTCACACSTMENSSCLDRILSWIGNRVCLMGSAELVPRLENECIDRSLQSQPCSHKRVIHLCMNRYRESYHDVRLLHSSFAQVPTAKPAVRRKAWSHSARKDVHKTLKNSLLRHV